MPLVFVYAQQSGRPWVCIIHDPASSTTRFLGRARGQPFQTGTAPTPAFIASKFAILIVNHLTVPLVISHGSSLQSRICFQGPYFVDVVK
ncbi:hypothetical protein SCLCIDRAFT_899754 [Scleroderma citrinum Foug A]|uniref:Uncharacterized protein n=1 Tax=Scleroderma citrinum Foug A TaxID=1036808 RepID=A0A0C3AV77_9AGAM|nr:hypothetical protein SCLCIDRAFT_899754 [Scleroderma citrinum Foug A]